MSGILLLIIGILVVSLMAMIVAGIVAFRSRTMPLASASSLLLVAAFCAYGFVASGEYTGTREIRRKVGYGTVGGIAIASAAWLSLGRRPY